MRQIPSRTVKKMELQNLSRLNNPLKTTLAITLVVVITSASFAPVHATGFQLLRTFVSPSPANDAFFGWAASMIGNRIFIGAPFDNTAGSDSGAVYVFNATTGGFLRTILSPSPSPGDEFGISLAALGSNILVGAHFVSTQAFDSGAAYLFDGGTGGLIQTFVNPNPAPNARFGESVAAMPKNETGRQSFRDTNILIGGFTAAYLIDRETGQPLVTVHDPNPAGGDAFGSSVAAVGGNILVGAHLTSTGVTAAGAAYLFDGSNGALLHTFLNPAPVNFGFFGLALASIGGNVIISAHQDLVSGTQAGEAFVFNATSGALVQTIPDPGHGIDAFGRSIAIVNGNVVIGAPEDSTTAINAGTVYVFNGRPLTLVQTILDPTPAQDDRFGLSLAASGGALIIGAPREKVASIAAGAAFLFG